VNRRRLLRAWVKLALLGGAGAFVAVFILGLLPAGRGSSGDTIDTRGLPAGEARLAGWDGRPVWLVHRTQAQIAALADLSRHVQASGGGSSQPIDRLNRSVAPAWGVYLATTDRQGVLVQYLPRRPEGLDRDVPWHGGFIDPADGALFDAAGRRYRGSGGASLPVPPHRFTGDGRLRLGEW